MKRAFDIILAVFLLLLLGIPILIIALLVRLTSPGSVLYWSDRVGLNNKLFKMPKFRSMKIDTPEVATHLLADPASAITPIGNFLRKTSLDELPQLWNILISEMSFVGPRPALFNQDDLITLRTEKNIHRLIPGLTGWAQINGRDELPIPQKVQLDADYMQNQSFTGDLYIIWLTLFRVISRHGINH
ncbi:undecaprenyl-phosphate galactose phosphotransferase [methanotrophic bacterial endosymbiont of Bathymodiolus sp.]|jgi:O-antigen biosynthesis protein WbqP|nr:undecaprenyl-phosphate galactose phosphotransferase [methanotrophic bacterial endosymbiont of Bathymodiolus sp.]